MDLALNEHARRGEARGFTTGWAPRARSGTRSRNLNPARTLGAVRFPVWVRGRPDGRDGGWGLRRSPSRISYRDRTGARAFRDRSGQDAAVRTTEIVLEMALDAGFDLAGVAPLRPPRDAGHFERWLANDHHAGMEWLARNADRITDPGQILPAGRSMLVVGLGHSRPAVALEDGARIARYAAGRDYHNLIGKRLRKLVARLRREGLASDARSIVDAGPLLERSHAEEAGLGFLSKAANLLHPTFGPWFFLGEVLLDTELEPTPEAMPVGSCGTCTACIDACPTAAIVEPGSIDSRLCISYWTIEHRGSVPEELREPVGEWAFGCDVCSEVCPWGHKAPDLGDRYPSAAVGSSPASVRVRNLAYKTRYTCARFTLPPVHLPAA